MKSRVRSGEFANASEYVRHCIWVAEAGEDAAMQHALRVRQLRTVFLVFQAKPLQARSGHQPD